jgi:hypothetical protein
LDKKITDNNIGLSQESLTFIRLKMKKNLSVVVFLFLNSFTLSAQEITAILCGNLIDGNSEQVISGAVILIEGERIIQIGTQEIISEGYSVIDLSEYTVLPGLIDMHVHPNLYVDNYHINHQGVSLKQNKGSI